MARRVRGEDETIGITQAVACLWKADWEAFAEQRVTPKQAMNLEAAIRRKLSELTRRRWDIQRRAILRR